MMEAKDGFIMYKGFWKPISRLTDEQLGRLFRAIYAFQLGLDPDVAEDIEVAYGFFENQFMLDNEKWSAKCEARREAGRKGGLQKAKQNLANPSKTSNSQICQANVAEKEKEKEKEKENENGVDVFTTTTIPSLSSYFLPILFFRNIRKAEKEATQFVAHYEGNDWTLQGGDRLEDEQRVAKAYSWNPKDTEPRFPEYFLKEWKEIYDSMPTPLKADALTDKTTFTEYANYAVLVCAKSVYNWAYGEGKEVFLKTLNEAVKRRNKKLNLKQY